MRKIILLSLILIYGIFNINYIFAQTPVKNVFSDIDENYIYYDELQTLYDRGMIYPEEDGNFNPKKLLNRDEFVGITLEASCKNCIKPNVDVGLVNDYYNTTPFFDLDKKNQNFYCIADSKENNYVVGYNLSHICEDGTSKLGERPFCVNNKISLEEAIAIILNNSGIFSTSENQEIINKIENGENLPDIADDVKARNEDGSSYSFYGYFEKALEYRLIEYDNNGNEKIYKLIEKNLGKLQPQRKITKEDFLYLAYILLKTNSCKEKENTNNIPLQINILDKDCDETKKDCNISDLKDPKNIYDFRANTKITCEQGLKEDGIIWRFYNKKTKEEIIKRGEYVDNFRFLSNGEWTIYLNVSDNCDGEGEVYSTIYINNLRTFDINYEIIGENKARLYTDELEGISYSWILGDGSDSVSGNDINHTFPNSGYFYVTLTTTDEDGNSSSSNEYIYIPSSDFYSSINYEYLGNNSIFISASTFPNSGDYSYSWDLGDGSDSVSGNDINHTFPNSGYFYVTLTTTDEDGDSSSSNEYIYIPSSDFYSSINYEYLGNNSIFISASTFPNSGNYSYSWDLGDGSDSVSGNDINHTFPNSGYFYVTLTTTDEDGDSSSSNEYIYIPNGLDGGGDNGGGDDGGGDDGGGDDGGGDDGGGDDGGGDDGGGDDGGGDDGGGDDGGGDDGGGDDGGGDDGGGDDGGGDDGGGDDGGGDDGGGDDGGGDDGGGDDGGGDDGGGDDGGGDDGGGDDGGGDDGGGDDGGGDDGGGDDGGGDDGGGDEGISTTIYADPLSGTSPLLVYFESVINEEEDQLYSYEWDFGDGDIGYGKNITHTYLEVGDYTVTLIVTLGDSTGNSSIIISSLDNDGGGDPEEVVCDNESDIDDDGVNDCDDICMDISGEAINSGCPILDNLCDNSCDCEEGYRCSNNDTETCSVNGVCLINDEHLTDIDRCYFEGESSIIRGNAICLTCPCPNFLDFKSSIRECDYILPAITSPDSSEIYSKGDLFRVE